MVALQLANLSLRHRPFTKDLLKLLHTPLLQLQLLRQYLQALLLELGHLDLELAQDLLDIGRARALLPLLIQPLDHRVEPVLRL